MIRGLLGENKLFFISGVHAFWTTRSCSGGGIWLDQGPGNGGPSEPKGAPRVPKGTADRYAPLLQQLLGSWQPSCTHRGLCVLFLALVRSGRCLVESRSFCAFWQVCDGKPESLRIVGSPRLSMWVIACNSAFQTASWLIISHLIRALDGL